MNCSTLMAWHTDWEIQNETCMVPTNSSPSPPTFAARFPIHTSGSTTSSHGDRVAVRVTLEATHTGQGLGVSATGRKVSIQGIIILKFVDGRIAEAWNSYDQLGLLRQIGALPGPPKRDTFLSAQK